MKEIKLPSGALLKVNVSPFAVSKALYQALIAEIRLVSIVGKDNTELIKDLFCAGFTSPEVEACLKKCFERCLYNGGKGDLKIDDDTFEPIEARDDYMMVCIEVVKENVFPFMKSLYAEYERILPMLVKIPT